MAVTTAHPRTPSPADRHARVAVAILFLTNGAILGNALPRYPQIKADLALSNTQYGIAIAAFPVGALLAGLTAGALIRRYGSARMAVVTSILASIGLLAASLSGAWVWFGLALLCTGAMDALTDVAQNAHGLRVQRGYGRSILNSLHAVWSVGAVLGGLMGAGAVALDLSRQVHLGLSAMLFSGIALGCSRYLLKGPDHVRDGSLRGDEAGTANITHAANTMSATTTRRTLYVVLGALSLIAMCSSIVEDAGGSWAAVYLTQDLHAAASLGAFGFVAMVGGQFIGRMLGDRCVDRFGQRAVVRTGAAIVALGMGLALALPTTAGTIAGFAAAGFGIATFNPAVMHAADELPGLKPGTGLTIVSWLMRVGFLMSPPIIGFVADATSLRAGLVIVPIAGIATVFLAQALSGRGDDRDLVSSKSAEVALEGLR